MPHRHGVALHADSGNAMRPPRHPRPWGVRGRPETNVGNPLAPRPPGDPTQSRRPRAPRARGGRERAAKPNFPRRRASGDRDHGHRPRRAGELPGGLRREPRVDRGERRNGGHVRRPRARRRPRAARPRGARLFPPIRRTVPPRPGAQRLPHASLGLRAQRPRLRPRLAHARRSLVVPRRRLLGFAPRSHGARAPRLARHPRHLRHPHDRVSESLRLLRHERQLPRGGGRPRDQSQESGAPQRRHREGPSPRRAGEPHVVRGALRRSPQSEAPIPRIRKPPLRLHARGGREDDPRRPRPRRHRLPHRRERPRRRILSLLSRRGRQERARDPAPHPLVDHTESQRRAARARVGQFHRRDQIQRRAVGPPLSDRRRAGPRMEQLFVRGLSERFADPRPGDPNETDVARESHR